MCLKVVSNSSPLIFLTKIPRLLDISKKFYEKTVIPNEVYHETVKVGLSSENVSVRENALKTKGLIEEKFVEVGRLKSKWIKLRNSLSKDLAIGESSAIVLALQENIENVLLDEKKATVIAKEFKLIPKPISILPVQAYRKNWIDRNEAIKILDELLINNYYLSSVEYKKILSLLE